MDEKENIYEYAKTFIWQHLATSGNIYQHLAT
jgi:hypothetical protein